jgi:hypothetical protein
MKNLHYQFAKNLFFKEKNKFFSFHQKKKKKNLKK